MFLWNRRLEQEQILRSLPKNHSLELERTFCIAVFIQVDSIVKNWGKDFKGNLQRIVKC